MKQDTQPGDHSATTMIERDGNLSPALCPALWSVTGTVTGDVWAVRDWLIAMLHDIESGERSILDPADPFSTHLKVAEHVAALNVALCAQGFLPPTVALMTDPLGFVHQNADFLALIADLVVDPVVAVH